MSSDRRAHLIETALRLFKRDGFHATGIDKILAESGVAKRTLYAHFGSKDELIAAALQQCDDEHRAWIVEEVTKRARSPRARLLALFDVYSVWISGEFDGCVFIKAASEYARADSPAHAAARRHKDELRRYIREQCEEAGARHPDALAQQLMMLLEGALVTALVDEDAEAPRVARDAAHTLLAAALPSKTRA